LHYRKRSQEDIPRTLQPDSPWLTLSRSFDSYDDLKAAITLYEKRRYQRCESYNDNPQATLFMRKQIGS
jgi:hypothetical protein